MAEPALLSSPVIETTSSTSTSRSKRPLEPEDEPEMTPPAPNVLDTSTHSTTIDPTSGSPSRKRARSDEPQSLLRRDSDDSMGDGGSFVTAFESPARSAQVGGNGVVFSPRLSSRSPSPGVLERIPSDNELPLDSPRLPEPQLNEVQSSSGPLELEASERRDSVGNERDDHHDAETTPQNAPFAGLPPVVDLISRSGQPSWNFPTPVTLPGMQANPPLGAPHEYSFPMAGVEHSIYAPSASEASSSTSTSRSTGGRRGRASSPAFPSFNHTVRFSESLEPLRRSPSPRANPTQVTRAASPTRVSSPTGRPLRLPYSIRFHHEGSNTQIDSDSDDSSSFRPGTPPMRGSESDPRHNSSGPGSANVSTSSIYGGSPPRLQTIIQSAQARRQRQNPERPRPVSWANIRSAADTGDLRVIEDDPLYTSYGMNDIFGSPPRGLGSSRGVRSQPYRYPDPYVSPFHDLPQFGYRGESDEIQPSILAGPHDDEHDSPEEALLDMGFQPYYPLPVRPGRPGVEPAPRRRPPAYRSTRERRVHPILGTTAGSAGNGSSTTGSSNVAANTTQSGTTHIGGIAERLEEMRRDDRRAYDNMVSMEGLSDDSMDIDEAPSSNRDAASNNLPYSPESRLRLLSAAAPRYPRTRSPEPGPRVISSSADRLQLEYLRELAEDSAEMLRDYNARQSYPPPARPYSPPAALSTMRPRSEIIGPTHTSPVDADDHDASDVARSLDVDSALPRARVPEPAANRRRPFIVRRRNPMRRLYTEEPDEEDEYPPRTSVASEAETGSWYSFPAWRESTSSVSSSRVAEAGHRAHGNAVRQTAREGPAPPMGIRRRQHSPTTATSGLPGSTSTPLSPRRLVSAFESIEAWNSERGEDPISWLSGSSRPPEPFSMDRPSELSPLTPSHPLPPAPRMVPRNLSMTDQWQIRTGYTPTSSRHNSMIPPSTPPHTPPTGLFALGGEYGSHSGSFSLGSINTNPGATQPPLPTIMPVRPPWRAWTEDTMNTATEGVARAPGTQTRSSSTATGAPNTHEPELLVSPEDSRWPSTRPSGPNFAHQSLGSRVPMGASSRASRINEDIRRQALHNAAPRSASRLSEESEMMELHLDIQRRRIENLRQEARRRAELANSHRSPPLDPHSPLSRSRPIVQPPSSAPPTSSTFPTGPARSISVASGEESTGARMNRMMNPFERTPTRSNFSWTGDTSRETRRLPSRARTPSYSRSSLSRDHPPGAPLNAEEEAISFVRTAELRSSSPSPPRLPRSDSLRSAAAERRLSAYRDHARASAGGHGTEWLIGRIRHRQSSGSTDPLRPFAFGSIEPSDWEDEDFPSRRRTPSVSMYDFYRGFTDVGEMMYMDALDMVGGVGRDGAPNPGGLSASQIAELPQGVYKDTEQAHKEERCPICLDDYNADDTVMGAPECKHYFHKDCFNQWLQNKRTCPYCRQNIGTNNGRNGSSSGPSRPPRTFGWPYRRRDPPGGPPPPPPAPPSMPL